MIANRATGRRCWDCAGSATAIRSLHCLGERGFALLTGRWRILPHITASPSMLSSRTAAVIRAFADRVA